MSATEDDTELRDLLIQNLENNGVLNKLKAEMRAAVFLAMEEQDKLENKSPLINENLKKCLNSREGRLVAGLIVDFLKVFSLDFSLAVFQPEINSLNSLDSRDLVCRDLGLSESEVNRNCPLLLELVRRGRHKPSEEPSQKQISVARKKFDFYDKDGSGSVRREDLKNVFTDLFPSLNKNMLEHFITDELRAVDQSFSTTVDFQMFVGFYKRLFSQCRAVVVQDSEGALPEEKISSISKDLDSVVSLSQGDLQHTGARLGEASHNRTPSVGPERERLDLDLEVEEDPEDGDSFFDDPLPKPQRTYGCLSVLPAEDRLSELRKVESSGTRGSPAGSLSEAPRPGPGPGGGSSTSEQSHSRNGASRGFRDPKAPNDKTGSLHLDDDIEYDDDFNSHRSDLSKSELSIGEEIEEISIEGPDVSDKFDESTQDLSVSQLSQSHGADYMEEVA
ncbi:centrosomal protein 43 isoform X2 [Cebidichthys violaceus]|uniref:centrosomal protein 43 isoform X2 n=1 Tax=Cebidichthys violaceus TaxID=271503 RepID=UPI0035CAE57E